MRPEHEKAYRDLITESVAKRPSLAGMSHDSTLVHCPGYTAMRFRIVSGLLAKSICCDVAIEHGRRRFGDNLGNALDQIERIFADLAANRPIESLS